MKRFGFSVALFFVFLFSAAVAAGGFLGESCREGRQWAQVVNFSDYYLEINFDGVPFSSESILLPGDRLMRCVSESARRIEIIGRKNLWPLMQLAMRRGLLDVPDLQGPALIAVYNKDLSEEISWFDPLRRQEVFFLIFMSALGAGAIVSVLILIIAVKGN